MYSTQFEYPAGKAEIAIIERKMYISALDSTAKNIIVKVFLIENLNPSLDCEIDSKPANAHGASTTILKTATNEFFSGLNAGSIAKISTPLATTAPIPISTPKNKISAAAVCTSAATFPPRMQTNPKIHSALSDNSASPK